MRAIRFLAAIVAVVLSSAALAADLPVKTSPPGVPYLGADPFNGFYIGLNGGYGFNRGATSGEGSNVFGNGGASFNTAPQGFVGGLQGGYNLHLPGSALVLGVEADGDIATLDGTQQNPGFIGNVNSKNRWLASIRGRLGYVLAPNAMAYVTGGWGWGSSDFTVTGTDGSQVNVNPTLTGAVLGGGLELAFTANWIARVEYLHYFLNDINGGFSGTMNGVPTNFVFHASDNVSLIRGGLSYKF